MSPPAKETTMPGSVSDAYDPEWGTVANAALIEEALDKVYRHLTRVLGRASPIFVLDLVAADLKQPITATLTEKEWRLLRFAVERAKESL
jgi:hypothetical protein